MRLYFIISEYHEITVESMGVDGVGGKMTQTVGWQSQGQIEYRSRIEN